jgi:NAD(P)-dependent dehydrogenase (short-subunit alcohol dehydrogenase family)
VAFVARSAGAVARVATETDAHGITGDVGSKDEIYGIAMQITGQLGGLDALINNASTLGPRPLRPLADTDCENLEHALAVNLLGPFRLTKALFGALASSARNRGNAVVVNISSDAAVSPYATWGAYGASKAALKQMTAIWDEEARDAGVQFVSLDPGDMNTPMHFAAIPDADPNELKRPEDAATELIERVLARLVTKASSGANPVASEDTSAATREVRS